MDNKKIYLSLLLFFVLLIISFNCSDDKMSSKGNKKQSKSENTTSQTDIDISNDTNQSSKSSASDEATSSNDSEDKIFDPSMFDGDITGSATPIEEIGANSSSSLPDGIAFKIGEDSYSSAEFEEAFRQFTKLSKQKISKKQFVPEFVGRKLLLKNATEHPFFKSEAGTNLLSNIKKQAVIEYYLMTQINNFQIKPTQTQIASFKKNCKNNIEEYAMLGLSSQVLNNPAKLKSFYINYEKFKRKNELFQSLKDLVFMSYNPKKVLEKYIGNQIDLSDAASSKYYKNYWILRINYQAIGNGYSISKKDKVEDTSNEEADESNEPENTKEALDETKETKLKNPIKENFITTDLTKEQPKLTDCYNLDNKILESYEELIGELPSNIDIINTTKSNVTSSNEDKKLFEDKSLGNFLPRNVLDQNMDNKTGFITKLPADKIIDEPLTEDVENTPNTIDLSIDKVKIPSNAPVKEEEAEEPLPLLKNSLNPLSNILPQDNESQGLSENNENTLKLPKAKSVNKKTSSKKERIRNSIPKDDDLEHIRYYYVKDLLDRINLLKQNNPKLFNMLNKNPVLKNQFIQEFILGELIYLAYTNNKLPQNFKKFTFNQNLISNFILNYYMKNFFSKNKLKQMVEEYFKNNSKTFNRKYFEEL